MTTLPQSCRIGNHDVDTSFQDILNSTMAYVAADPISRDLAQENRTRVKEILNSFRKERLVHE